jgi:hypothetical protein
MLDSIVLPTHPLFKNLTGQPFGRLTVLRYAGRVGSQRVSAWLCECKCGNTITVRASSLQGGNTESCGCFWHEQITVRAQTHGLTGTPEYRVWAGLIARCENLDDPNYGGRGISVCARWRESFSVFLADMGRRPSPQHTIERINNNGNYEPNNCRWAIRLEQNRNKRNNHLIEHNGATACITEWAEKTGLPPYTIQKRLAKGWPISRALETPKRNWSRAT